MAQYKTVAGPVGLTIDKKPLKDHLEAVGHRDAFLYVQDLVKNNVPFSESIIKLFNNFCIVCFNIIEFIIPNRNVWINVFTLKDGH